MGEKPPEGEPTYLELEDALELYAAIIGGTVVQAGDHLRNRGGLEGALARPQAYARYGSGSRVAGVPVGARHR